MLELNSDVQRYISESLMADLWQTRQIAHPSYPGSKWVLVGPQLRGRLVMMSDLFDSNARLSISSAPRSGHTAPDWQLVARFASAEMVLAMARVAETASDVEPVAWSRRLLNRRLRAVGWKRDTGRLRTLFSSTTVWESPCGCYRLGVSAKSGHHVRTAELCGPDTLVTIGATTPVAVVASLAEAVAKSRSNLGKGVA
ncbi:hypothetical protein [Catenulispora rubra]|uniref:hypothetical protein n=1 Tax=Catenulispora rubra TaxID=280293 RepID=UPI0018921838|nr:hypothetical protein [Catenulispora rubra]